MQNRMKQFSLTREEIDRVLENHLVGRISTIGADGYPYTVSVHYYYDGESVYFHGLPVGEKIANIKACDKVCFEVSELKSVMDPAKGDEVCTADAEYESVVIRGRAQILSDPEEKRPIFQKIVAKYLPHMETYTMPENMVKGAAVVKISIENITGKYHK